MIQQVLEPVIQQYNFNLDYARKSVEDLSVEQMTIIPANGIDNHPAFTLGHLVSGSAMLAEDLGQKLEMPEGWAELFLRHGPGDPRKPDQDKSKYPSKETLIGELHLQHEKVKKILMGMDERKLNEKLAWRFSRTMPTLLDNVVFMCITHEAMHLGQLAVWRRAMNLPSALGALR